MIASVLAAENTTFRHCQKLKTASACVFIRWTVTRCYCV